MIYHFSIYKTAWHPAVYVPVEWALGKR